MRYRFVDRITEWETGKSISGTKSVSFEEYMLREELGAPPGLPESLVMESLLQLGNWLIVLTSGFTKMGVLVRFEVVEFFEPAEPGAILDMQIRVRRFREDGVLFDGRGTIGGRAAITGRGILAAPVPLADYEDPSDLRTLAEELYSPHGPG